MHPTQRRIGRRDKRHRGYKFTELNVQIVQAIISIESSFFFSSFPDQCPPYNRDSCSCSPFFYPSSLFTSYPCPLKHSNMQIIQIPAPFPRPGPPLFIRGLRLRLRLRLNGQSIFSLPTRPAQSRSSKPPSPPGPPSRSPPLPGNIEIKHTVIQIIYMANQHKNQDQNQW